MGSERTIFDMIRGKANKEETARELRDRLGVQERTFQKAWLREFRESFAVDSICTPEQIETMEARYKIKKARKIPKAGKEASRAAIALPVFAFPKRQTVYLFFVRMVFASAVLIHSALVWSEVAYLWRGNGVPGSEHAGFIAGLLWFLFTCGALISWTTRNDNEVQDSLFWAIVALDIGAGFLHYYSLSAVGIQAYVAGIRELGTACFSAGFVGMAVAAAYFYKEHAPKGKT